MSDQHRPGASDPFVEPQMTLRRIRLEVRRNVTKLETNAIRREMTLGASTRSTAHMLSAGLIREAFFRRKIMGRGLGDVRRTRAAEPGPSGSRAEKRERSTHRDEGGDKSR